MTLCGKRVTLIIVVLIESNLSRRLCCNRNSRYSQYRFELNVIDTSRMLKIIVANIQQIFKPFFEWID